MTWYASHIYTRATPQMITHLQSHQALKRGLYLVNDLESYPWPEPSQLGKDIWKSHHSLPDGGLLVARELCGPGANNCKEQYDEEVRWYSHYKYPTISWDEVAGPSDYSIILPPDLPVLGFGKLFPGDSEPYPPVEFLRFLKWLSLESKSVVAFYRHRSGAEGGVDQEYSWVFDRVDCVYVRHVEESNVTWCYAGSGASKVDGDWLNTSPLKSTMQHFNVQMGSGFFALHTRGFPWAKYKIK